MEKILFYLKGIMEAIQSINDKIKVSNKTEDNQ